MAQQGKQMRDGARKGFKYNSGKLVFLVNGNKCEVYFNTIFPIGKSLYPVK
jgi:hypothetical protein